VPNLIRLGEEYASFLGHGLLAGTQVIYYVADSVDPMVLPRASLPAISAPVPRIPRGKILDVFTSLLTPEYQATTLPVCPQVINPVFDRQPGYLLETGLDQTNTILRRGFAQLGDGRWILQRTRATALDFHLAPRPTPGWVP
jgi:hypothetical protein